MSNETQAATKIVLDDETKKSVTLLQISNGFLIIFPIVSLILLLIKKQDFSHSDVLKSHTSWQLKTIIYSFIAWIIFFVLTMALAFVMGPLVVITTVGYPVLIVWYLYRVIKGALRLHSFLPV